MIGIVLGKGEWAISGGPFVDAETQRRFAGLVFQHLKKPRKIGAEIKGKKPYNSPPFYLGFLETSDIDLFIENLQLLKAAVERERGGDNE